MTIIVGYSTGKTAWIGADRMYSNNSDKPQKAGKLWRFGDWAIGISGDSWAGPLIEMAIADGLELPSDPFRLALALKQVFKDAGYTPLDEKGEAPSYSTWAILAHQSGAVYELYRDLRPYVAPKKTLVATGAGSHFAVGAAHGRPKDWPGEAVIDCALRAAIACSPTCGLGTDTLKLGK